MPNFLVILNDREGIRRAMFRHETHDIEEALWEEHWTVFAFFMWEALLKSNAAFNIKIHRQHFSLDCAIGVSFFIHSDTEA